MTAARLSPAGTLLRNSKLFAIPAPIQYPAGDQFASDTATTFHPVYAALETPRASLMRGDWGLKRNLPTRTTTKTSTPTFRIRGGIDTPEHVADFESAADHVITLRKYHELNVRTIFPPKDNRARSPPASTFSPELDNTSDDPALSIEQAGDSITWLKSEATAHLPSHLQQTLKEFEKEEASEYEPRVQPIDPTKPSNLGAEQPTRRRWRYKGPYLAGISELEFDSFLKKITPTEMQQFREVVRDQLIAERISKKRAEMVDEGRTGEDPEINTNVTSGELNTYLRNLRSEPSKFGPLIAKFFDLADGPTSGSTAPEDWPYGRDTIASDKYKETGPPKTHPSAGLTYQFAANFTHNDVKNGPLAGPRPFPARILQSSIVSGERVAPSVGVAGFVAYLQEKNHNKRAMEWIPEKDGRKTVITPKHTVVREDGRVDIISSIAQSYTLVKDEPVAKSETGLYDNMLPEVARMPPVRMPHQDRRRRVNVDQSIIDQQRNSINRPTR